MGTSQALLDKVHDAVNHGWFRLGLLLLHNPSLPLV